MHSDSGITLTRASISPQRVLPYLYRRTDYLLVYSTQNLAQMQLARAGEVQCRSDYPLSIPYPELAAVAPSISDFSAFFAEHALRTIETNLPVKQALGDQTTAGYVLHMALRPALSSQLVHQTNTTSTAITLQTAKSNIPWRLGP